MTTSVFSIDRIESERFPLLGVKVQALSIRTLNQIAANTIRADDQVVVASVNMHSVYLHRRQEVMRQFFDAADYLRIDGMPLVLWGKLLGYPLERENRVTWLDWIHPLMADAARNGWRVFYLGSMPGVADRAASYLHTEFPGLQIETAPGYFDATQGSAENEEVIRRINGYHPDILMVGMGMPRQEKWILENRTRLNARLILPCGACFDYLAGEIQSPPRWMGRIGMEWLARLVSEPKRLWRRYLIEPIFLLDLFLSDVARRVRPHRLRARG